MKNICNVVVFLSFVLPGAASAGTPAFADLLSASAGVSVPAQVLPGAVPAPAVVKGLTGDVSDLAAPQAGAIVAQAKAEGFAVFQLDGAKMTTKPALMAHTAQVLGLPRDMANWDAMIDYMGDLPQIHCNDKLLIVVKNASMIQRANPALYADFRDVAQLSSRRMRDANSYPVTIKFVFVP